jgi:hypothetical protein
MTAAPDIILFSALYGDKEPLNLNVFGGFRGSRTVLVSDRAREVPAGVELILDAEGGLDPARASRRSKLMPHRFFPEAEWSVWLDNKSRLLRDPAEIVAAVQAQGGADFFAFPHFRRDCVYDEGQTVWENGLDDYRTVRERMNTYRAEGMPRHFGLIEGHFIVRRHTEAVAAFGEQWFDQVCRHSRRDQISFPYLVWKSGFPYTLITALQRRDTVILAELDRLHRKPDFPRKNLAYQRLRRLYHRLRRRA